MAQAPRDENRVPALLATSSADGITPVAIYADPSTHRLLVANAVSTGVAAPNTTPAIVGAMYVDTNAKKVYVATGTASSTDWTILN